jgi:hypothetical protein
VSFTAITLCVASQRVVPKVSVYFFIDSVRKLLDTLGVVRSLAGKKWWSLYIAHTVYWYLYFVLILRIQHGDSNGITFSGISLYNFKFLG